MVIINNIIYLIAKLARINISVIIAANCFAGAWAALYLTQKAASNISSEAA